MGGEGAHLLQPLWYGGHVDELDAQLAAENDAEEGRVLCDGMGRDIAERTDRELSRKVGAAHLPVPNDDVAAAHARDAQTMCADPAN